MKIKLCGFSEPNSLEYAVNLGCDFVGVVFVKNSIRFVEPKNSLYLSKIASKNTSKVAVVSNQNFNELLDIYNNFSPNFFQLHGSEDPQYISKLKNLFPMVGIIKALSINTPKDLNQLEIYQNNIDYFLFDNKNPGSGQTFDWDFLNKIQINKPWFLSGGINVFNLQNAITKTTAQNIDISSGIEEQRGIKSQKLIHEILHKFNQIKYDQEISKTK